MSQPSIQHLQDLQALLQALGAEGIELDTHQYDAIAFGSFVLVLSRGHTKARFMWDGKDSLLTVEYQKVRNKATAPAWKHHADIKVSGAKALFQALRSNAAAVLT